MFLLLVTLPHEPDDEYVCVFYQILFFGRTCSLISWHISLFTLEVDVISCHVLSCMWHTNGWYRFVRG